MSSRLLSRRSGRHPDDSRLSMASIKTFARIKPADDLYDDYDTTRNRLYLRIPDSYGRDSTLYNRTRAPIVNHEFKYSQVFPTSSTQEEVFSISAKNIIDGFLEGYNGTIFAYGQTSSGKTYTMQGDLTDLSGRGLTPRSLTRIFNAVDSRKQAGENISMHCSYLEIYQEVGYDLLKMVNKTGPGPSSFAKVTVVDGPEGAAVVKNLSIHAIASEEAAQALLAQGESNRKVAETAMNNRSSRSHAVFTVYLSSRKGDLLVRSKMHFVDLAGSERVCKTGVKGLQLSEAKYINLSLHYLEGVIIALHQHAMSSGRLQTAPSGVSKSWSSSAKTRRPYSAAPSGDRPRHIPYRNSLLTMLLKDSLGGNCLTTMIATISLEMVNLSESISTCRFAQRVSCISNTARKNEEIDDKSMIKRLRTRVAELEAENNVLKHGGQVDVSVDEEQEKLSLTAEDRELCQHVVKEFLNGRLLDPIVAGVTDPFKFRECMSIFKRLIKEHADKSLRLAEKLQQQPSYIQEAFYTGGRYHEAPLTKPVRRQEINFRDDANALTKHAYYAQWNPRRQRTATPLKPTILKSATPNEQKRREPPAEAWQLQLHDKLLAKKERSKKKQVRIEVDPRPTTVPSNTSQSGRPKPQSAAPALRRTATATPFERKKNQEVSQLNKKVEENLAQQVEQTNHLKAFQKTVIEQELEIAMQTLKRKIEVTQHQLQDQHKYTQKLKRKSTDADLVEQEELVEQQLQKRVNKLLADLNMTSQKLKLVTSDEAEGSSENSRPQYRSVQDKFANVTKKDGTIDRVKVMTTLEQQKRLQTQLQKKIDQQRALVIDKHLEVKEQSTRQKLEEFKRKLAESREGQQTTKGSSQTDVKAHYSSATAPSQHTNRDSSAFSNSPNSTSTQQNTFQKRIEDEKQLREESIGDILGRYRTPSAKDKRVTDAAERTAQVDQILAKYRKHGYPAKIKNSKGTTSPSKTNPKTCNPMREIVAAPSDQVSDTSVSEKESGYSTSSSTKYSTVQLANSAMRYRTTLINKNSPEKHHRYSSANQMHTSRQAANTVRPATQPQTDIIPERDFDKTLKSMLLAQQGHQRKRTEAWKDSKSKERELEKGALKSQLHQYLTKQLKKKQKEFQIQDKARSKQYFEKQNGLEDNKHQPQHTTLRGSSREFSHRSSHYQKKPVTVTLKSKVGEKSFRVEMGDPMRQQQDTQPVNNMELTTPNINQPATEHVPKHFTNLKKMNRKNEHSSKIRQIQNATLTIQRAWRRHRSQT